MWTRTWAKVENCLHSPEVWSRCSYSGKAQTLKCSEVLSSNLLIRLLGLKERCRERKRRRSYLRSSWTFIVSKHYFNFKDFSRSCTFWSIGQGGWDAPSGNPARLLTTGHSTLTLVWIKLVWFWASFSSVPLALMMLAIPLVMLVFLMLMMWFTILGSINLSLVSTFFYYNV